MVLVVTRYPPPDSADPPGAADPAVEVHRLATVDVDTLDTAGVAQIAHSVAGVRAWLDHLTTRLAARVAVLHAEGVCGDETAVLAGPGRLASRDARQAARRAEFLASAPAVAGVLAAGSLTAAHVDAIVRLSADLDDPGRARLHQALDDLVALGTSVGVERFERTCRELGHRLAGDDGMSELERHRRQTRVRTWRDRRSGMYHLTGQFDPETGATIVNALEAEMEALRQAAGGPSGTASASGATAGPSSPTDVGCSSGTDDGTPGAVRRERLAARALLNLLVGDRRGTGLARPEVMIVVDADSLSAGETVTGGYCELSNGHPVPVAVARRLLCTAAITLALRSGDRILHLGRTERVANRAQRRALRALYRTCAFPECHTPSDRCHIHHLHHWERLGTTDLWNLLPLCEHHHHAVHDHGWTLHLAADRTLTITRPDRTIHATTHPDMPAPPGRQSRVPDARRAPPDPTPPDAALPDLAPPDPALPDLAPPDPTPPDRALPTAPPLQTDAPAARAAA
jgi:hypothetical protein